MNLCLVASQVQLAADAGKPTQAVPSHLVNFFHMVVVDARDPLSFDDRDIEYPPIVENALGGAACAPSSLLLVRCIIQRVFYRG